MTLQTIRAQNPAVFDRTFKEALSEAANAVGRKVVLRAFRNSAQEGWDLAGPAAKNRQLPGEGWDGCAPAPLPDPAAAMRAKDTWDD